MSFGFFVITGACQLQDPDLVRLYLELTSPETRDLVIPSLRPEVLEAVEEFAKKEGRYQRPSEENSKFDAISQLESEIEESQFNPSSLDLTDSVNDILESLMDAGMLLVNKTIYYYLRVPYEYQTYTGEKVPEPLGITQFLGAA